MHFVFLAVAQQLTVKSMSLVPLKHFTDTNIFVRYVHNSFIHEQLFTVCKAVLNNAAISLTLSNRNTCEREYVCIKIFSQSMRTICSFAWRYPPWQPFLSAGNLRRTISFPLSESFHTARTLRWFTLSLSAF